MKKKRQIANLEQRIAELTRENNARIDAAAKEKHVSNRIYYKQFWPAIPGSPAMIRYGWTCMHPDGECGDGLSANTPAGFPADALEALR